MTLRLSNKIQISVDEVAEVIAPIASSMAIRSYLKKTKLLLECNAFISNFCVGVLVETNVVIC